MRAPTGSVVALSSASATMSALGIAFLGYWGVHEPTPWHAKDIVVVCLAFIGFIALGAVVWIATTPIPEGTPEKIDPARRAFAAGFLLLWLAIVVAIVPA